MHALYLHRKQEAKNTSNSVDLKITVNKSNKTSTKYIMKILSIKIIMCHWWYVSETTI